ncbi:MAG: demethylmenaquinone methyltransferase [Clostridia bacterium]|nr:demethylmenaquinone methyltransferase [Clostridia bacterium]
MKISTQGCSNEDCVHQMFSSIADKYDWMNRVMTFGLDNSWRRFAVEKAQLPAGGCALDVCCGTGKITLELAKKAGKKGKVIGLDFCEEMLKVAQVNLSGHPLKDRIELVQGNAIALPFSDNSFDCATIGFALRNVPDLVKALQEMIRVVKPGGRVVSLELAKPSWPVFKQIYWLYFDKLVPLMGKFRVGIEGPYSYLPNSVKLFPHQKEITRLFSRLGLQQVAYYELTGGIVAVHVGIKPNNENF